MEMRVVEDAEDKDEKLEEMRQLVMWQNAQIDLMMKEIARNRPRQPPGLPFLVYDEQPWPFYDQSSPPARGPEHFTIFSTNQSEVDSCHCALEDLDGAACAAVAEPVEPQHVPQTWSGTGTQSRVFTLQYFQDIVLYTTWKGHNVALKYLRADCEWKGLEELLLDSIVSVPEIEHDTGTQFRFLQEGSPRPWEWQQMVAQLDDASMQIVVQGEDNRSRGIVSCCMFQAGSYDHKRHHATGKCAGNRAAGK